MSRLTWGATGSRFYETGVDHGVLYVDDVGVAWSGLISVSESPSGGSAKPYYMDAIKYLNRSSAEEFEATLTAFYSPPEFDACDGASTLQPGFSAAQQRRKSFGLSYRTRIGNDLDESDHGYKIHLVYNALAAPASRDFVVNDAAPFNWRLTTSPVPVPGASPSAHFTLDSTEVPSDILASLEEILYGNDDQDARLPMPDEILGIFQPIGQVVDSWSKAEMGDADVDLVSAYTAAKS